MYLREYYYFAEDFYLMYMKRVPIIIFTVIANIFSVLCIAQDTLPKKHIISAGYGVYELFYYVNQGDKDGEEQIEENNYKLTGQPEVFYLKFERTNKAGKSISHNLAFSCREVTNDFKHDGINYPTYHASRTRIAFSYIFRKNYFLVDKPSLQIYYGYGIGVRITLFRNYKDNEPYNFEEDDLLHFFCPVAAEAGIGCRFFITKNIGVYTELGVAKTPIQGGICISW